MNSTSPHAREPGTPSYEDLERQIERQNEHCLRILAILSRRLEGMYRGSLTQSKPVRDFIAVWAPLLSVNNVLIEAYSEPQGETPPPKNTQPEWLK